LQNARSTKGLPIHFDPLERNRSGFHQTRCGRRVGCAIRVLDVAELLFPPKVTAHFGRLFSHEGGLDVSNWPSSILQIDQKHRQRLVLPLHIDLFAAV
jgi:hypothetical protein